MIIPILLVIFLTAGLSLGQTSEKSGTKESATSQAGDAAGNVTASEGAFGNGTAGQNGTAENATSNLNYIWSMSGLESGQVTMVLNQAGGDLYGAAKYEPDSGQPWNAVVVGSVVGDKVDLVITALKDKELVSSKLDGTFDSTSQTIKGRFFQVSDNKIGTRGDFDAMWINPDTSSYAPAKIEETAPAAPAAVTPTPAPAQASDETATANTSASETTTPKKPYYTDVHEYADKIGPGGDLSGVPPGMGGSSID